MKDTVDSGRIIGKFVGRYIAFGIIIGGISFILENWIPQLTKWEYGSTLIIYQTVLFVISTLLIVALAVRDSMKNVKLESKGDAMKIAKPIKTLLMIVALLVMIVNLVYGYGIQQSGYKDAENKYKVVEGVEDPQTEELLKVEKDRVHSTATIYLAGKEIVTIFTYAYAVIYAETMIVNSVSSKKNKEEVEE